MLIMLAMNTVLTAIGRSKDRAGNKFKQQRSKQVNKWIKVLTKAFFLMKINPNLLLIN